MIALSTWRSFPYPSRASGRGEYRDHPHHSPRRPSSGRRPSSAWLGVETPISLPPSAVGRLRVAYDLGRNAMLARVHASGHPDVTPAMIGLAMPQNISINRAGLGRVRVMVAPS